MVLPPLIYVDKDKRSQRQNNSRKVSMEAGVTLLSSRLGFTYHHHHHHHQHSILLMPSHKYSLPSDPKHSFAFAPKKM